MGEQRFPNGQEQKVLSMLEMSIRRFSMAVMTAYQGSGADLGVQQSDGDGETGEGGAWVPDRKELEKFSSALRYALADERTLVSYIQLGKDTSDLLDSLQAMYGGIASTGEAADRLIETAETKRNYEGKILKPQPGRVQGSRIDIPGLDEGISRDIPPVPKKTGRVAELKEQDRKRRIAAIADGLRENKDLGVAKPEVKQPVTQEDTAAKVSEQPEPEEVQGGVVDKEIVQQTPAGNQEELVILPTDLSDRKSLSGARSGELMWVMGKARGLLSDVYVTCGLYTRGTKLHPMKYIADRGTARGLNRRSAYDGGFTGNLLMFALVKVDNVKNYKTSRLGHIKNAVFMDADEALRKMGHGEFKNPGDIIAISPALGTRGVVYRLSRAKADGVFEAPKAGDLLKLDLDLASGGSGDLYESAVTSVGQIMEASVLWNRMSEAARKTLTVKENAEAVYEMLLKLQHETGTSIDIR